ncbi:hypothetical protein HPP92_021130 [Vanilla planifolia]|uniref:Mitochondrial import inner membrane translocase subunit Tim17/Tim22/Tim23 family protein n=1 Tax=Vanilla planifolia TaxID=51239 RepID=A0A835UGW4_VANPL|nr:hypothetical protein HPP92_021130 [Vanilla planifolia]
MTSAIGEPSRSSSDGWKERITIPTLLAGLVGGGAGLVSKHRKAFGVAKISATYATNFAITTACYCGAREIARDARDSELDDLMNSAIGGFASGALLGRLQGTAVDYATLQMRPFLQHLRNIVSEGNAHKTGKSSGWWKLPEWSPIQVLDEEALAAKRAREEQFYAQKNANQTE